jgi:hypothetical protein
LFVSFLVPVAPRIVQDCGARQAVAAIGTQAIGRRVTLVSLDVDGLRALAHAIRLGVEGDLLAVLQGLQAGCLERRDVDEHVFSAAVRRDEAEALVLVEEFNDALGGHGDFLFPCCGILRARQTGGGQVKSRQAGPSSGRDNGERTSTSGRRPPETA